MDLRQKEYLWIFATVTFYILTGYWGVYNISLVVLWPIFAIPMSLLVIKTGQKELVALIGVILSVIVSFVSTATFHPIIIATFLLFILAPAFVFGILYHGKVMIPRIIIAMTLLSFLSWIIFLTFAKLLGIDYLEIYFSILDTLQNIWNHYLTDIEVQKLLPQGEGVLELYVRVMANAILVAKRTYPATLFTVALITSTIHLLIVQLIARIRSWSRPAMSDILNVGLSPVAAWVLLILWITTGQVGNVDTIWTFAIESMLSVLFTLFQVIGLISIIVMIMKMGATKIIRILLSVIGIFWLIFNPALLVVIGCMDSMFNFRKVKTLI